MIKQFIKDNIVNSQKKRNITGKYKFMNNSKGSSKMCFMLIGYKEILWGTVLERLKKYTDEDIDVCLTSSGLYSPEIEKICKENGWSYISTKRNNLCLATNITIKLFPEAKFIYKLDEDMFISKGFYKLLLETFNYVKNNSIYDPGIVAPLIPINGYGFSRLIDIFNKREEFENEFGVVYITAGTDDVKSFTKNPKIPTFFWNKESIFSDIDKMNYILQKNEMSYSVCPIRFSIGAILFERKIWEDMGGFTVRGGNGMAIDEIEICEYCNSHSLCTIVSENSVVGHLAYGPQTGDMYSYYEKNKNIFVAKEY